MSDSTALILFFICQAIQYGLLLTVMIYIAYIYVIWVDGENGNLDWSTWNPIVLLIKIIKHRGKHGSK